jgi:AraC-like DNA-binding protein
MRHDPDEHDEVARPIVGIGNDHAPATELALHTHRRGQLLRAVAGVIVVSTPQGAWVAPPQRAVWIPAGVPHAVRMIGAVTTRSLMVAETGALSRWRTCRVIVVSPLLAALVGEAVEVPVEYDEDSRDGLLMRLLLEEIARAALVPLVVPFPADPALAARCHAFLERPDARATIDAWSDALALNRRSFTRLFRKQTGMSFAEWRQQACLSVALPRLATGDAITTIAFDLGYESPASFAAMFKRIVGSSPSQYR